MGKNYETNIPRTQQERANTIYWAKDLDEALGRNDDKAVWDLISLQHDQESAHDMLATLVARLRYRVSGKMHFAEMMMIPIITEGENQPNLKDRARWTSANYALSEGIDNWRPKRTRANLQSGFVPLDQIGLWKPEIIRHKLLCTVPGQWREGIKLLVEDIDLPAGAPKLWFLPFVLTGEEGWPRTPEYSEQSADQRLQQVVRFAITGKGENAPMVLPPERVQHAMADGVCMWLLKMAQQVGLRGWTAIPGTSSPDVLKITLALEGETPQLTQFILRRHQLGAQGVNDVLVMLQGLAPMLDHEPLTPVGSTVKPEPRLYH